MSDRYELDADAVKRTAAAVRKIERLSPSTMPPPASSPGGSSPYRKAWYRIVSSEGDGTYTARLQRWDPQGVPPALIDIDDVHHPEYGLDQDAWDVRGQDTAAAGDRVGGWQTWINGQWCLLIDAGGGGGDGLLWGKLVGDWTNGNVFPLDPCDIRIIDNGQPSLNVFVYPDKSGHILLGDMKIPDGTRIPYQYGDDGLPYVVGTPRQKVVNVQSVTDAETGITALQKCSMEDWGLFETTPSTWSGVGFMVPSGGALDEVLSKASATNGHTQFGPVRAL